MNALGPRRARPPRVESPRPGIPAFSSRSPPPLASCSLVAPFTEVLPPRVAAVARDRVAVCHGAQLPVTPIMLTHFNQLSLIGVAANLLVVPLAGPATTLGMLALLVALGARRWPLCSSTRSGSCCWRCAPSSGGRGLPAAMVHLPAPSGRRSPPGAARSSSSPTWPGAAGSPAAAGLAVAALSPSMAVAGAAATDDCAHLPRRRPGRCDLRSSPRAAPAGRRRTGRRATLRRRRACPLAISLEPPRRPPRRGGAVACGLGSLGRARRDPPPFHGRGVLGNGRWGPRRRGDAVALERSGAPRRVLRAGDRHWLGGALLSVLNPDGPTCEPQRGLARAEARLAWRLGPAHR